MRTALVSWLVVGGYEYMFSYWNVRVLTKNFVRKGFSIAIDFRVNPFLT